MKIFKSYTIDIGIDDKVRKVFRVLRIAGYFLKWLDFRLN